MFLSEQASNRNTIMLHFLAKKAAACMFVCGLACSVGAVLGNTGVYHSQHCAPQASIHFFRAQRSCTAGR